MTRWLIILVIAFVVQFNLPARAQTVLTPACDTSGVVDCTTLIQNAINTLEAGSGGTVFIPAGIIKINCNGGTSGATVSKGAITIKGEGYEEYSGVQGGTSPPPIGTLGTNVFTSNTSCTPFIIRDSANSVIISDMLCTQVQPSDTNGWTPTAYQPCFFHGGSTTNGSGGRLTIERVMCWGVYWCINLGYDPSSWYVGRDIIRDVEMCIFQTGLSISAASDIIRTEDLHIFPFCYDANQPHIKAYVQDNAVGVASGRNDDPDFSNIFIYGTKYGFRFTSNSLGVSARVKMNNIECDAVDRCLSFESSGTSAFITNLGHQPPSAGGSPTTGREISIDMTSACTFCRIYVANSIFTNLSESVVNVDNGKIALTGTLIQTWNRAANGSVAINAANGSIVTLGSDFEATGGGGPSYKGGAGTFQDTHMN